jgi:hypothetical protein
MSYESSKISYLNKLVKNASKKFSFTAVNKAISYGEKYERYFVGDARFSQLLSEAYQIKKRIADLTEMRDAILAEKYDFQQRLKKDLRGQGIYV